MTYDVWAAMPQVVNNKRSWSKVATAVTAEQAEVYRSTFHFPIHIEEHAGTGPTQPYQAW